MARKLTMEIPGETLTAEVESRLRDLSRTSRVPGFRPGKAPIKIVRQRYGSKVREEALGEVLESSLSRAIDQQKLRPAGSPELESLDVKEGEGIVCTFGFEILPEIALADMAGIEIEISVCEPDADDIDKVIESIRAERMTLREVRRAAGLGDVLDIDFTSTVDGERKKAEHTQVELGGEGERTSLGSGFESGLLGCRAGQKKTLKLEFPGDYRLPELAGKPVRFDVSINKVMEPVLPELDETFFREFGVEDGDERKFRERVREYMDKEATGMLYTRNRNAVLEALYQANPLTLPQTLVTEEKQRLTKRFKDMLPDPVRRKGGGDDDMERFLHERAERHVAIFLLMEKIIDDQNLAADPRKVREAAEQRASYYDDPASVVNWYYRDKNRLKELEALALESAVLDWVLSVAAVTKAPVSFDELRKTRQTWRDDNEKP